MIDLTPLDVRQKKTDFPRILRGYDPGHVDDFLGLVADRLEALIKENRKLAEEVGTLRASADEHRDREKALTEALVSAQQMREEMREQTNKEAELMRREAEQEARKVRNDALLAIEKEEETLRRLRARQRQLVEGYRAMLEREMRELAVVADSLDAADSSPGTAASPTTRTEGHATSSRDDAPASASASGPSSAEPDETHSETDRAARAGTEQPESWATPVASAQPDRSAKPDAATKPDPSPKPDAASKPAASAKADSFEKGRSAEAPTAPVAPVRSDAASEDAPDDAGPGARDTRPDPWAIPPAAARPVESDRGEPRQDRYSAPAASLDSAAESGEPSRPAGSTPGRDDKAAGAGNGPRGPGDEPDWLAAILKED